MDPAAGAEAGSPLVRALADASIDGAVRLDRFMELALYARTGGYYTDPGRRLGVAGDFYTAAHASPLFGRCIANWLLARWHDAGEPSHYRVLELGPGDGTLAADVVAALSTRLPPSARWGYRLEERGPGLASRALARARSAAGPTVRPTTLGRGDDREPTPGAVVANELLDAQPCRRLR